jgi:hypothetical protein
VNGQIDLTDITDARDSLSGRLSAGKSSAARMAMMAITTSNSISVKARFIYGSGSFSSSVYDCFIRAVVATGLHQDKAESADKRDHKN